MISIGSSTAAQTVAIRSRINGSVVFPAARNAASTTKYPKISGAPARYVPRYRRPSAVTSSGVSISAKRRGSKSRPVAAVSSPSANVNASASPTARAASSSRRSPCRRAASAVSPTLTISAIDTISQIQKIDVLTAASPAPPTKWPTHAASSDTNAVSSSALATAGTPTRTTTRNSASSERFTSAPPVRAAAPLTPEPRSRPYR